MIAPPRVTYFNDMGIGVADATADIVFTLQLIGFAYDTHCEKLLTIKTNSQEETCKILHRLRDMSIPFGTDRSGGAGYLIQRWKEKGLVAGSFVRIDTFAEEFKYVDNVITSIV